MLWPAHPWKYWASTYRSGEADPSPCPVASSRWSQGKDLSWEPLRPELVVEVAYDDYKVAASVTRRSFAGGAADKKPSDCTYDQLEVVPPQELAVIFAGNR